MKKKIKKIIKSVNELKTQNKKNPFRNIYKDENLEYKKGYLNGLIDYLNLMISILDDHLNLNILRLSDRYNKWTLIRKLQKTKSNISNDFIDGYKNGLDSSKEQIESFGMSDMFDSNKLKTYVKDLQLELYELDHK